MITTVTLNVSVDKAYKIKGRVNPGTVARVLECTNTAGGKGLNVARIIDLCGEEVQAAGFAGGFNGAYVESMLKKDGILGRFTKAEGETRSCINILAEDMTSTEYLEPGEEITKEELDRFLKDFEQMVEESQVITISGSMPKGVSTDTYAKMIKMAKDKGKKVILDTSGDYLKEGIKAGPTMIKPNQEELEAILGIKITDRGQMIEAAQKIRQMGVDTVVISLGKDGAMVISSEGIFHGKPPVLDAKNPVGCGDSMVGAFAVAMKQGKSTEESLAYAIAVSAANAVNPQTGHFNENDRKQIQPKVTVDKIG